MEWRGVFLTRSAAEDGGGRWRQTGCEWEIATVRRLDGLRGPSFESGARVAHRRGHTVVYVFGDWDRDLCKYSSGQPIRGHQGLASLRTHLYLRGSGGCASGARAILAWGGFRGHLPSLASCSAGMDAPRQPFTAGTPEARRPRQAAGCAFGLLSPCAHGGRGRLGEDPCVRDSMC